MRHEAVLLTIKAIGLSSGGLIASATGVLIQLNTPHQYLNLQLPYWFFLTSTVVLTVLGAFLSLRNDYMRSQDTPVANFMIATITGIVISFVMLPVAIEKPSVGILQLTGFIGGLFGTIALRVLIELVDDDDLRVAVKDTLKALALKWLARVKKYLGGGD